MELIVIILVELNNILNTVVMPFLALVVLSFIFIFKLLPKWIKQEGVSKGLYFWILQLIPVITWAGVFWFGMAWLFNDPLHVLYARWGLIWFSFGSFIYFRSRKHGEKRGIKSALFHLTVFTAGWSLGNWFGILFISLPILVVYYHTLYYLADAIVPASDPENRKEKWQRALAFFWYTWGLQHPMQVVVYKDAVGRKVETRIEGDSLKSLTQPGIIWLKSHQAAALTAGINFSRIEAPRVVFTKAYERLLEVVDLRTLVRTAQIDAVTKDGVRFKATVLASFALDRDKWTPETYSQLFHKNPDLLHGMKPDANKDGIYPFSRPRIKSALMMRGNTSAAPEQQTDIFWDQRVINQVEVVASHVLSERRFDELWHPLDDGPGKSALDEIANTMKERVTFDLLSQGVRLFAARVIAFDFTEYKEAENLYDNVIQQQIESWRVEWEGQRSQILSSAEAESSRLQQEARAYVQSILLTAIAEGLQETRIRYPNLPRHVIAMRFVGALAELARHHSENSDDENAGNVTSATKPKDRITKDKRAHYL